jgi:hypothetical protein
MSNVHDGSFIDKYTQVVYRHGSRECSKLEQRYSGIRFNQVEARLPALFCFSDEDDQDYVGVCFNISRTVEALQRHGLDKPTYTVSRSKTRTGIRLNGAEYMDGLDRVATLFMPELLARFARKEPS